MTCIGHISIMAHLNLPSFLLVCGCMWRWQLTHSPKMACTASWYTACASVLPPVLAEQQNVELITKCHVLIPLLLQKILHSKAG